MSPIRVWSKELKSVVSILRTKLNDSTFSASNSGEEFEEIHYLAFRVAVLVGQIKDAQASAKHHGFSELRIKDENFFGDASLEGKIKNLAQNWIAVEGAALRMSDIGEYPESFYYLSDIRRLVAASRWAGSFRNESFDALYDLLESSLQRLDSGFLNDFRRSARGLISDYLLYPETPGLSETNYRRLFSLSGCNMEGVMLNLSDLMDRLGAAGVSRESMTVISEIVNRLAEIGRLEEERIPQRFPRTWDGGWGGGQVMVIPGGDDGDCSDVLLALTDSGGRSEYLPRNVIPQIRRVIHQCANKVEVVIFLSDLKGMSKAKTELFPDMTDFIRHSQFRCKAFIPVLNIDGKITVLDWA